MNNKIVLVPLLALFACSTQAALLWQPAPAEKASAAATAAHAGHGAGRGGKRFILQDSVGGDVQVEAELMLPTLVRRPLVLNAKGRVAVEGTGLNGYHMLFARKQAEASEQVAMRYLSLRGKPVEVSPSLLVNVSKATLDITPAPLTREHQRYLSLKPASFLVRYRGKPLAQHAVLLTTTNGSEITGQTDARGRATLTLPDDFNDVKSGRSNNRPSDFTIATSLQDEGYHYHTAVSAPYYVSPSHWRSFSGGLLAMVAGVVGGALVLQRSRSRNGGNMAGEA